MSVRRREFITLIGGAAGALPLAAQGEEPAETIGFLGASTRSAEAQWIAVFLQRLLELGWIDGRTIAIEYRWAEGSEQRFAQIATEFVRLKVDIIVTWGSAPVVAAKQATSVIPIVFVASGDPIGTGLVVNLARPGGNITGFLTFEFSIGGKWLEVLKEIAPRVNRVAFIFN